MTPIENLVQTPLANALGWTLLHSLWEGAAGAVVLAAALSVIQSSRIRYAAACLAMLGILVGFGVTFGLLMAERAPAAIDSIRPVARAVADHQRHSPADMPAPFSAADLLPWLAPCWIAGVVLFHLRSLVSWMAALRLRRRGVCTAPDPWPQRFMQLSASLGLAKRVTLLESCLARVPVVIGYLRPVILVPVGLLAGMPAGQIEAILLHELAHIRRRDYLVNLLQTLAEDFLFYHPAIWWISGIIRAERENCCDDLVVALKGDAPDYARALTTLEQNRWAANEAALAATGGSLMKRIRRLLYPLEAPRAALTPVFSAGILTITAAVALAAWQAKPAEQSRKAPAPEAVTTAYDKWLDEDVAYIIDNRERAAFTRLASDAEREKFIEQFWLRRDPTPDTVENEFKEEHYRRIGYANGRYQERSGLAGWKTDRGRIYITFGPPDEIESHPVGDASSNYPFEQWLYRHIDGMGENVVMEFVDKERNGEYRMSK